jgi:hypothetical protein
VTVANTARINKLNRVYEKRLQRLTEIHLDAMTKVEAPYKYQLRLLDNEEEDILRARLNAITDANDAFDDLIFRLESFSSDIQTTLDDELDALNNVL